MFFKKQAQFGDSKYTVEISREGRKVLIQASGAKQGANYEIRMEGMQARSALTKFDKNLESMAKHLTLVNKRLYLLNPSAGQNTNTSN